MDCNRGACQGNLLSTGTPFNNQLILGLGLPLAPHVSLPSSPGDSTRFWGAMIQYGAALWMKEKNPQTFESYKYSSKSSMRNYFNNKNILQNIC